MKPKNSSPRKPKYLTNKQRDLLDAWIKVKLEGKDCTVLLDLIRQSMK